MTSSQVVPVVVVGFMAWRIYLRLKRSVGRQPWHPRKLVVRAVYLGVISVVLGVSLFLMPRIPALEGLAAGLIVGVPIAFVGLHLTQFETTPEGKFYTPNLWLGLVLTMLFAGRFVYRVMVLATEPPSRGPVSMQLFQNPLTLVLFGLTAGYYIAYNVGVLVRGRKLAA